MKNKKNVNDRNISEFEKLQVSYKELCEWQDARRRCFDLMVDARSKRSYYPYAHRAKELKKQEQHWKRAYWHWAEKCNEALFGK